MDEKLQNCSQLLEHARNTFVFSAYQAVWGVGEKTYSLAHGSTKYWPGAEPVTEASLFDIGSVTKAVVGGGLLARALSSGRLKLDANLGTYLPAVKRSWLEPLTLRQLASHTAGIAAWVPLFKKMASAESFVTWVIQSGAELKVRKPGERAEYSDIGFLLLSEVLKTTYGDIEGGFRRHVAEPLGLKETVYRPASANLCVATEVCRWRNRLVQGEVFDENCAYLGGVTAHAGLFSTARGLAPLCREWLKALRGQSQWLSQEVAKLMTARSNMAPNSSWGVVWDTRSKEGSSAGQHFSELSFGHLGYTGASVWIDPTADAFAILWTNRIHPSRVDDRVRVLRPLFHDAVASYWRK